MIRNRWIQLLLGLVSMTAISSPQYVWALFTQPLTTTLGVSLAEIQVTFSILIVVQTFLSPPQGLLIDRFGPRLLLSGRRRLDRLELGAGRAGDVIDGGVPDLWSARRCRHRDHLHRCHRPRGAMVPRSTGSRHRRGRCRLRLWRPPDHVPDLARRDVSRLRDRAVEIRRDLRSDRD